jgi:hypothetical protein
MNARRCARNRQTLLCMQLINEQMNKRRPARNERTPLRTQ